MTKFKLGISIHSNKKIWYKYIIPKRLTLKCNPPIYRWLWWVCSTTDRKY